MGLWEEGVELFQLRPVRYSYMKKARERVQQLPKSFFTQLMLLQQGTFNTSISLHKMCGSKSPKDILTRWGEREPSLDEVSHCLDRESWCALYVESFG